MVVIDSIHDLHRILRENPEWREEMRRIILTDELLELPQRFAEYAVMTDRRLDNVEHRLDRMQDDIGDLKGIGLESKLHRSGLARFVTMFGLRNTRRIRYAEYDNGSVEFEEAIYDAEINGIISDVEYARILHTDMIARGRIRGQTNTVYLAVEASYSVSRSDITKVCQSGEAIGKVFTSADVRPAIYCAAISDELFDVARDEGVSVVIETNIR